MGNSNLIKNMKTTIFALCIIGYTLAAQGLPLATSYCAGNVNGAVTCSSCYNYTLGTIGARQLIAAACTAVVANTVGDCKIYNRVINATKSEGDCELCNNKTWLNLTANATAASIVAACSNTPLVAITCNSLPTNCDQAVCRTAVGGATAIFCRSCSASHLGAGVAIADVGYPTCIAGNTITNCSIYGAYDKTKCEICIAGFAVDFAGTACTAFTDDTNCKQLGSTGAYCGQCKDNYYFTTNTCTIGYTVPVQGTPAASSYCAGNVDGATTCTGCYNYTLGTIGARQLLSGACAAVVANTVTDCKIYNNVISATKALGDCEICSTKTWLNITDHATAASIVAGCSNTAAVAATCTTASIPTNCDQAVCFTTSAGVTSVGCRSCTTLYKGSSVAIANVGYPTCVLASSAIANCSIYGAYDITKCEVCITNFAVNAAGALCTAFTTDAGCRQLATGNTYCGKCKDNYYFTTTTCTIGYTVPAASSTTTAASSTTAGTCATTAANMIAVSALIMSLLFFFN